MTNTADRTTADKPSDVSAAPVRAGLFAELLRLPPAGRVAALAWAMLTFHAVMVAQQIVTQQATLSLEQLGLALLITLPPVAAAVFLRQRMPRLSLAAIVMATLLSLAFFATASTSLLTMWARPLVDPELAAMDRTLGFDGLAWIAWARQPVIDHALWLIYQSTAPQTLIVVALLAYYRRSLAAWTFAFQLAVAASMTIAVFAVYPSIGPFPSSQVAITELQQSYLDVFVGLRYGEDRTAHLFVLTGLVTFPSFHAAWAAVLIASFRPFPRLLPAIAVLNGLVLLAAITHGCHYLVDVVTGFAIGLIAVQIGQATAGMVRTAEASPAVQTASVPD